MITIAILILIVAKALPGLNTQFSSFHLIRITSIVFLFAGALTLNSLFIESIGGGIGIYSGFFQITIISQLIEIFLFMIGGGILIAWPQIKHTLSFPHLPKDPLEQSKWVVDKEERVKKELSPCLKMEVCLSTDKKGAELSTDYSLVVLFSSLGSSLLISSYDLISVYLSIELQSFGGYVLSTLYRDSESSTSAGLKYFLLGGLSSCIILLGTGIIYSYTGTTNLESLYIINSIIDVNQQYIIQGISLGLSLIFIGFLFKIAAAPLHNWSPDVYDGTPTIVTIWLTIIPKIAILFILLELQIKLGSFGPLGDGLKTIIVNNSGYLLNLNQINESLRINLTLAGDNILKTLLLISATLSLIIGSLLGLAQIRIKRLLAYSTISHIGFILLALAVNTEQSIDSFIFYIIQYTITNLNIFLVILGLTYYTLRVNNSYHTSLPGQPGQPAFLRGAVDSKPWHSSFYLYSNSDKNKEREVAKAAKQGRLTSNRMGSVATIEGEIIPSEGSLKGEHFCLSPLFPSLSPMQGIEQRLGRVLGEQRLGEGGNKDISFISEFKGLFFSNPLLSISLALSLFSMAGIPPLIGFFSKQLVLYSALQNGYYFISLLAIIVSVISCSYYLQIIKILITPISKPNLCYPWTLPNLCSMPSIGEREGGRGGAIGPFQEVKYVNWISKPKGSEATLRFGGNEIILTNTHSYLISTLTFTILLFFIKPSLILNSTQLLSLSLFYI